MGVEETSDSASLSHTMHAQLIHITNGVTGVTSVLLTLILLHPILHKVQISGKVGALDVWRGAAAAKSMFPAAAV